MARWLAAGLLLALAGLAWPVLAQEFRPPFDLRDPGKVEEGRTLFNGRCAGRCHGVDGMEGFEGPILYGKAYLDPPFVFGMLIAGRPGSAMPSWKGRLSDDDLWQIIAFVSSLGDQARGASR